MITRLPAFIVSLMLLSACGGGTSVAPVATATPPAAAAPKPSVLVQSSASRELNPSVTAADLSAAARANTDFGFALLARAATDERNVVISPYSMTLGISMVAAGAKGNTLSGIFQALSIPLPQERHQAALNQLDLLLKKKFAGTGSGPSINVVNSVWAQDGYALLPTFLDTLASTFGAGVRVLDFAAAPEAARADINAVISQQTNGRIPALFKAGAIRNDTRLVLANAIWFKAMWQTPFYKSNTRNETFTTRSGATGNVPFMHDSRIKSYSQGSDYQALDLGYEGANVSMTLILPAEGGMEAFLTSLNASKLENIVAGLSSTTVNLSLPKFTFESSIEPGQLLDAMGMSAAFSPSLADLSGITGKRDLYVGNIVHKGFISVDEEGTEAAAATGATIDAMIVTKPVTLSFNRPFLFVIRDRDTGLVLFMGKVASIAA